MRRIALLAVAALAAGSLAACTPADDPMLGLAVREGQATALLVTCVDVFSQVGVSQAWTQPDDGRHFEWDVHGKAATEVVEVALFGAAPEGWTTNDFGGRTDTVEPLTELDPGAGYSLHGLTSWHARPLHFTAADLQSVGDGQVLVPDDDDAGKSRVVSYASFLKQAKQRPPCRHQA